MIMKVPIRMSSLFQLLLIRKEGPLDAGSSQTALTAE